MKEKTSHFQLFSLSFQRPLCSSPWVSYLNSLLYMVFWNPMSPQCMIILHLLFLYVSGHEFYRKAGHTYRGAKSKLGGMFSPNPCNIWLSKSIKGFSSGGREVWREMSGRAAVEETEQWGEGKPMWSKEAGHPLQICLQDMKGPLDCSTWLQG